MNSCSRSSGIANDNPAKRAKQATSAIRAVRGRTRSGSSQKIATRSGTAMSAAQAPQPARTEELAPALRLVFQGLPDGERDGRVANALHLLERGELDPQGFFVLRGRDGPLAAIVCVPVPGAMPGSTASRRNAVWRAAIPRAFRGCSPRTCRPPHWERRSKGEEAATLTTMPRRKAAS